jgi:hypothetical protein
VHVTDLHATILNLHSSPQSRLASSSSSSSFKTVTHTSGIVGVGVDQWRNLIGGDRESNTMAEVPREEKKKKSGGEERSLVAPR